MNGIIFSNGENSGFAAELGNAREHYAQIYDDRVLLFGLTDNQDMLKLSLNMINENHHGVICVKVSDLKSISKFSFDSQEPIFILQNSLARRRVKLHFIRTWNSKSKD